MRERGLGVSNARARRDDDVVPRAPCAPAEVGAVAESPIGGIRAAQSLPDAPRHDRAREADGEDVLHFVVLTLVEVVPFGEAEPSRPAMGDRRADVDESGRIVPTHLGRADDAREATLRRLGEQVLERIGVGGGVIVEQPQPLPLALLDRLEQPVHRLAEGRALDTHDFDGEAGWDDDVVVIVKRAAGDDHEGRVDGSRLRGEGGEGLGKELGATVRDDEGANKRSGGTHLRPSPVERLDSAPLEFAALTLGKATPDAKALIVRERVVEALRAHVA